MRIGIIGMGNLGSATASLLAKNGHDIIGWDHNAAVVEEINSQHINSPYLPGIDLDPAILATNDIRRVIVDASMIFVAIPSVFVQPTFEQLAYEIEPEIVLVNMAKGIDRKTGLTSFQTISTLLPLNPKVMLSGPSIANEFAREMPTVVVLASEKRENMLMVAQVLDSDCFRTRFSDDTIGVELGGILKNIYAIGLGMFDGKNITSVNFRAVYLTIALEEIAKIGIAMGASLETFLYLSGIGDLLATSMSEHSHNRRLGEYIASGLELAEIKEKMGVLPEGYNTLQIILYVAEKLHVSIPLAKGLWDVIHGRFAPGKFIRSFIKDFVE